MDFHLVISQSNHTFHHWCIFTTIVCTYAFYFCVGPYLCVTLLCICVSHAPYEVGEGVVSLCLPVPVLLCICLSLLVWPFNFTERPGCAKINLMVSGISVIIILVKLLQMIWGYSTSFKVWQSFCLCLCLWKICISYHNRVMSLMPHFSGT